MPTPGFPATITMLAPLSPRSWLFRVGAAALLFQVVFVLRTSFVWNGLRHFVLFEDAMISMRYARNFARGDGLNWNAGEEHVEGYTNLLWTLWMSAVHKLGLPDHLVSLPLMITGIVLVWLCSWLAYKIAASLSDVPWVPPVSAAATLCCYSLNFWSLRGMEVGAVASCASSLAYLALCHDKKLNVGRTLLMGLVGAASVMLRSDSVLLLGLAALYAGWRTGGKRGVAVFAAVMMPAVLAVRAQLGFRRAYYGETLPNTYYLKLAHISPFARIKRGLFVALEFAGYHAPLPLAAMAASLHALGLQALKQLKQAHKYAFLALIVLTQAAYAVYVGGDAWEFMLYANRYWSAVMPLFAVLTFALLGEAIKADRAEQLLRALRPWIMVFAGSALVAMVWGSYFTEVGIARTIQPSQKVLAVGSLLFGAAMCAPLAAPAFGSLRADLLGALENARSTFSSRFAFSILAAVWALGQTEPLLTWARQNAAQYADEERYAKLGILLRDHTPKDFRIAVMAAGATPYFADRPTEDLLGKSDAHVAKLPPKGVFSPGHDKWDYGYSIGQRRPDLIVELSDLTPDDVQFIKAQGYVELPSGEWLRTPSRVPASLFAPGGAR